MIRTILNLLAVAVAVVVAKAPVPPNPSTSVQPLNYASWAGQKVMMISAHPDDIEAAAGGLVALLTAANVEVGFLIVTNGDKGCGSLICTNWTSEQLAVARAQEAVNAAAVLGVPASNVWLLDYEDGMVTSYPEQQIREDLVTKMREWMPHVVMSWYPFPRYELLPSLGWSDLGFHPDHQAVGGLTLSAQFSSGIARLFPLAGPGWHPSEYYAWEFVEPTHYVDISSTLQAKINSWLQHKTQYPVPAEVVAELTLLGERMAAVVGVNVSAAEGFRAYF